MTNNVGICRKINLGCGQNRLPGFVNIDVNASASVDLVCNMLDLPFAEGSLDIVYMCHSLEHIPLNEVLSFTMYLNKLLSKGGKLFVSVPDFNVLSSMYLAGKVSLATIARAIHGGQEYHGNTHFMSYDYTLLSDMLFKSGFTSVRRYAPSSFLPADYADTSTYAIAGIQISLNVCAIK